MYIVQINSIDSSCHTQQIDAEYQEQIYLERGYTNIEIVEKDTFNPA